MRKLLQTLGLSLVMAMPAAAFAQGYGGNFGYGGQMQMNEPLGNAAAGVVHGRLRRIDAARGVVLVHTRRGMLALHAMPTQLAGLQQGELLRLPFVRYDGALWISPRFGAERAQFWGEYGQQGRLIGTIQNMNLARGFVLIDGRAFRIHPAFLRGVVPGEQVHVRFVTVGQQTWITMIRPARQMRGIGMR